MKKRHKGIGNMAPKGYFRSLMKWEPLRNTLGNNRCGGGSRLEGATPTDLALWAGLENKRRRAPGQTDLEGRGQPHVEHKFPSLLPSNKPAELRDF